MEPLALGMPSTAVEAALGVPAYNFRDTHRGHISAIADSLTWGAGRLLAEGADASDAFVPVILILISQFHSRLTSPFSGTLSRPVSRTAVPPDTSMHPQVCRGR